MIESITFGTVFKWASAVLVAYGLWCIAVPLLFLGMIFGFFLLQSWLDDRARIKRKKAFDAREKEKNVS